MKMKTLLILALITYTLSQCDTDEIDSAQSSKPLGSQLMNGKDCKNRGGNSTHPHCCLTVYIDEDGARHRTCEGYSDYEYDNIIRWMDGENEAHKNGEGDEKYFVEFVECKANYLTLGLLGLFALLF